MGLAKAEQEINQEAPLPHRANAAAYGSISKDQNFSNIKVLYDIPMYYDGKMDAKKIKAFLPGAFQGPTVDPGIRQMVDGVERKVDSQYATLIANGIRPITM
jgi:hypothetical protein